MMDGICAPFTRCPNYIEVEIDPKPRLIQRNDLEVCAGCLEERKAAHFMAMQKKSKEG